MGNIFSVRAFLGLGNILRQIFFIPTATLTENNCPDQTGRVFLVTGGYAGIGFELCKILYAHNATVCIAGRDVEKSRKAISEIKKIHRKSNGSIDFLYLDLSNLSTIKPAVDAFTSKRQRLDVLVNNAGVMYPPEGSLDAQGNDLQMGTNCLGPYLLYQLLLPLLTQTAATSPTTASVRVVWAGSVAIFASTPHPQGIVIEANGCPKDQGVKANYAQTKVGNVFLARECAKSTPKTGVVHAAFNPGNSRTEIQRHWIGLDHWIADKLTMSPAIYGAYTELWTALTPELTPDKSGAYVWPWGRFGSLPEGVEASMTQTGVADKFVEWCRNETEPFL